MMTETITPVKLKNREEAGEMLSFRLEKYKDDSPLLLALPRGGVPVAYEIADRLNLPLDVLVVRKLGPKYNPEFGFGAIAPGDVLIIDNNSARVLGLKEKEVNDIITKEFAEMERRITHYKSGEWSKDFPSDTVIIVDDGLATGVTARAAIESAKLNYKPKKIIFAAPVCAKDSMEQIKKYADETICLLVVENLQAIGLWYDNFNQVSDSEVLDLLEKAKK